MGRLQVPPERYLGLTAGQTNKMVRFDGRIGGSACQGSKLRSQLIPVGQAEGFVHPLDQNW